MPEIQLVVAEDTLPFPTINTIYEGFLDLIRDAGSDLADSRWVAENMVDTLQHDPESEAPQEGSELWAARVEGGKQQLEKAHQEALAFYRTHFGEIYENAQTENYLRGIGIVVISTRRFPYF